MFWDRNSEAGKAIRIAMLALTSLALAGCASSADRGPAMSEAPPPPPPPPPPAPVMVTPSPEMVVVRGSANALVWYPVGSRVAVDARICLPAGARYITFQRTDGGTVTYGGGGCNKRIAEPPRSQSSREGAGSGP